MLVDAKNLKIDISDNPNPKIIDLVPYLQEHLDALEKENITIKIENKEVVKEEN